MSYRDYTQIQINSKLLSSREIVDYCRQTQTSWMEKIGNFMAEWLNEDPYIRAHTSGSTSAPKEMLISKNQMLESAALTARFFHFEKGQNALLCLPVSYIAGKMMIVRAFYSGLNLTCIEPDSHPLGKISTDNIIHFAPLIPMQLKGVENPTFIKKILLGGSPVSPAQEDKLQSYDAEVYISYGMTETLSHVALRRINGRDKSEVYYGLPGVIFTTDERNCLVIDVPFLPDSVFTNDVVELIDESSFIWKGRFDNVVISGGLKFYPEEIEKKLFPFISERFFVAGLPDERFGERLCLFIEGDAYPEERFQRLVSDISANLEKYQKPRDIYFVKKFMTTESGKVRRNDTTMIVRHG